MKKLFSLADYRNGAIMSLIYAVDFSKDTIQL